MAFIQVGTYSLASRRGPTSAINSIRVAPTPAVGSANSIDFVQISYPPTTPSLPVGTIPPVTPPNPRGVFAFLPPEEFENHRRIFLTESPIEIEWQPSQLIPGQLDSFLVRTRQEVPGEGMADRT